VRQFDESRVVDDGAHMEEELHSLLWRRKQVGPLRTHGTHRGARCAQDRKPFVLFLRAAGESEPRDAADKARAWILAELEQESLLDHAMLVIAGRKGETRAPRRAASSTPAPARTGRVTAHASSVTVCVPSRLQLANRTVSVARHAVAIVACTSTRRVDRLPPCPA
jgi:hypothetical protein